MPDQARHDAGAVSGESPLVPYSKANRTTTRSAEPRAEQFFSLRSFSYQMIETKPAQLEYNMPRLARETRPLCAADVPRGRRSGGCRRLVHWGIFAPTETTADNSN